MFSPVNTLPQEERRHLAAVSEMTLKLAGERDPEMLLQAVSHSAREIMHAQFASVGVLEEYGQTIRGRVFFSGLDAMAVMPAIPVLRPGLLADMLTASKAVRLRDVTWDSLGSDLFPGEQHLSSLLGIPFTASGRVRGWLFLANKVGAVEFSDQDEQMAVTLAAQMTGAYERMEAQKHADEELSDARVMIEAVFESAPDAIAAVDRHGRIVLVNAQTQNLFGYTWDELIGQPIEILVPERFRAAHPARREQYSSRPLRRPWGKGWSFLADVKRRVSFPWTSC
jgi:PAS domain-containing protein